MDYAINELPGYEIVYTNDHYGTLHELQGEDPAVEMSTPAYDPAAE